MTRTAKRNEIVQRVGIVGIVKKAHRFLVMNFESIGDFALMNSAPLAGMAVSLAGLAVLLVPILAIVGLPTAAPAWALFTRNVFRLPLSHAVTAAKVVSVYLGISAAELLAAPFTVEQLTTPAKQNLATFKRASKLFSWLHPVGFDNELLSAHWTSQLRRDCVGFAVGLLAVIRAKPKPRRVTGNLVIFPFYRLAAMGALQ